MRKLRKIEVVKLLREAENAVSGGDIHSLKEYREIVECMMEKVDFFSTNDIRYIKFIPSLALFVGDLVEVTDTFAGKHFKGMVLRRNLTGTEITIYYYDEDTERFKEYILNVEAVVNRRLTIELV